MKIYRKINNIAYSCLMLFPLVAVLSSCSYSTFNKNATDKFTRTEIVNPTILTIGNKYHFEINNNPGLNNVGSIAYSDIYNIKGTYKTFNTSELTKGIQFYTNGLYLKDVDNQWYYEFIGSFDFVLAYCDNYDAYLPYITETVTYTENRDLRNTFYYSVEQINEQPLFNWVTDSFIYDPINHFTTYFGLQDNSFVSFIMSYWLTTSLVWFGYEVICFMINFARGCLEKFEDKSGGF